MRRWQVTRQSGEVAFYCPGSRQVRIEVQRLVRQCNAMLYLAVYVTQYVRSYTQNAVVIWRELERVQGQAYCFRALLVRKRYKKIPEPVVNLKRSMDISEREVCIE